MRNRSWRDRNESDFKLGDVAPGGESRSERDITSRLNELAGGLDRVGGQLESLWAVSVRWALAAVVMTVPAVVMFHSQLSTLQTENRAALVSISSLHTKVMALQSDLSRLEGILLEEAKSPRAAKLPPQMGEGALALEFLLNADSGGVLAAVYGEILTIEETALGDASAGGNLSYTMTIESEGGYLLRYGRLADIADGLAVGDWVEVGQRIGESNPA